MINKNYLNEELLEEMRKRLYNQQLKVIQLHDVLEREALALFKTHAIQAHYQLRKKLTEYHYSECHDEIAPSFFDTIQPILTRILGKKVKIRSSLCRFAHRDYTLVHAHKNKTVIFFDIFSVPERGGGYTVLKKDEHTTIIPATANALTIMLPENCHWFVKYCNVLCKQPRYVLTGLS